MFDVASLAIAAALVTALGLAAALWREMFDVDRRLAGFDGFEGIHFDI
jgi:hypothetical protein